MAAMRQVDDQLLQEIVDRLVEALHPREIYLFGSRARDKSQTRSDVDIMLVVDDNTGDLDELTIEGRLALRGIGVPVDLLVFDRSQMKKWAPVKFSIQNEATRKGKLLYVA